MDYIYPKFQDPLNFAPLSSLIIALLMTVVTIQFDLLPLLLPRIAIRLTLAHKWTEFLSYVLFTTIRVTQYPKKSWKFSQFSPFNHYTNSTQIDDIISLLSTVTAFIVNLICYIIVVYINTNTTSVYWLKDPLSDDFSDLQRYLTVIIIFWTLNIMVSIYGIYRTWVQMKYSNHTIEPVYLVKGIIPDTLIEGTNIQQQQQQQQQQNDNINQYIYSKFFDPLNWHWIISLLCVLTLAFSLYNQSQYTYFSPSATAFITLTYFSKIPACLGLLSLTILRIKNYPQFSWKYSQFSKFNHYSPTNKIFNDLFFKLVICATCVDAILFVIITYLAVSTDEYSWMSYTRYYAYLKAGITAVVILWAVNLGFWWYTIIRAYNMKENVAQCTVIHPIQVGIISGEIIPIIDSNEFDKDDWSSENL